MSADLFSTSKISTDDRVLRSCAVCCLPGLDCSTQWCGGNFINIPSCCTITAQRVRERVGVDECKNLLDAAHIANESLDHWNTGAYSDVFTPRTFVQLPDKQTCFLLLQEFFEYFLPLYPIFYKESFMNQVHKHYDGNSCQDISCWASIERNFSDCVPYARRKPSGKRERRSACLGSFQKCHYCRKRIHCEECRTRFRTDIPCFNIVPTRYSTLRIISKSSHSSDPYQSIDGFAQGYCKFTPRQSQSSTTKDRLLNSLHTGQTYVPSFWTASGTE